MKDEAFFDTNIIAYAFDDSNQKKMSNSKKLIEAVFGGHATGYVSNQVLGELYAVLTSGVRKPVPKETARIILGGFLDSTKWIKVDYTHETIRRTLEDSRSINAPFWDLLIAETMKEAGVYKIYTENVKDFGKVSWLDVVNPLTATE